MKPILLAVAISCASSALAADAPDPHDHKFRNPPTAAAINSVAAKSVFSKENTIEEAGSDAIEYYDVGGGVPKLDGAKPTIIGRVVIKKPGVYLKESKDKLPTGEYVHWIAKVGGAWISGFAAKNGTGNAMADVRFAVMSEAPHKHLQVYTHSPEGAKAWADYAARKSALPGTPAPVPPIPQLPKPPTEWRCVEVWKWVEAPDGTRSCTVTGWVRVPAN